MYVTIVMKSPIVYKPRYIAYIGSGFMQSPPPSRSAILFMWSGLVISGPVSVALISDIGTAEDYSITRRRWLVLEF